MSSRNWEEIFVGREKIVEKLIDSNNHFFLFGARRIGKTSIIRFIEPIFNQEKSIPAFYFTIQGFPNSIDIKNRIEACFKINNFKLPNFGEADLDFFEFLDKLDIQLKNKKIVFLIDEVEQLVLIEEKEEGFLVRFRNRLDSLNNIRFILVASPHFKKLIANVEKTLTSSPLLSAFSVDILPELSRDETDSLIKKIVPEVNSKDINEIINYTHYQPYYIKIFLNKLFKDNKLLKPNEDIAQETYVTNALDGIFPNYFEGLNAEDQNIIKDIHKSKFKVKPEFKTNLYELVQYGYLKHEKKKYHISNWFFDQWLRGAEFELPSIENKTNDSNKKSIKDLITGVLQKALKEAVVKIILIIILVLLALIFGLKIRIEDILAIFDLDKYFE